jgi:hypothetical protein
MSGLEQHASGSSNLCGGGGLPRAAGNNRPAQSHNLQSHNINTRAQTLVSQATNAVPTSVQKVLAQ